jgi:hypothetical protein
MIKETPSELHNEIIRLLDSTNPADPIWDRTDELVAKMLEIKKYKMKVREALEKARSREWEQ